MGNFYTSSLLSALRRLRTFATTPAKPVPSSTIVAGSGMVVMVPLMLMRELAPMGGGFVVIVPVPKRFPLAFTKLPVPPVSVYVNETVKTVPGGGGGGGIPVIVPT